VNSKTGDALEGKIRTNGKRAGSTGRTGHPKRSSGGSGSCAGHCSCHPSPNEAQAGLVAPDNANYGGASAASKALNPDVSVIGDFVGAIGGNSAPPLATLQPFPSLQMHESEIGLQAIIDPYARGDFFISFGEEGSIWKRAISPYCAAGRICGEGWQDAICIWQGQSDAQPRAALG